MYTSSLLAVPTTSSPDVTVPESVGAAEVCVTVTSPLEEDITLGYITVDGTASGIYSGTSNDGYIENISIKDT